MTNAIFVFSFRNHSRIRSYMYRSFAAVLTESGTYITERTYRRTVTVFDKMQNGTYSSIYNSHYCMATMTVLTTTTKSRTADASTYTGQQFASYRFIIMCIHTPILYHSLLLSLLHVMHVLYERGYKIVFEKEFYRRALYDRACLRSPPLGNVRKPRIELDSCECEAL